VAQAINVNGVSINYPETGDTNWSDDATNFAVQTSSALGKIGLSSGTSVDVVGTLDVTGATTLDSTLTVAGTTTLNGTANLNGNTNLGNATSDTIAVTGILNVDSGVLYVDPTNNRVGVNKTNPAQALDVTGNALISGTLGVTGNSTFTGDVIASIVKASGSGGLTIDSNGGTDVALFGAGGGSGTTLYGGLNGTTGNFADTTDATTSTDGALKTAGGVGIAKKLFVGTDATLGGVLYLDDSTTANTSVLSFTGDTNTGIGRSAADTLDYITGGASRARIGSTGQQSSVVPDLSGSNTTLYNEYKCRAWVNFNGTGSVGSQTIRGSGNISSVTKNSTGIYTVNIDTDMPDANYAVTVSTGLASTGSGGTQNEDTYVNTYLAGSFVITTSNNGTYTDMVFVAAAVFR
jgi:hypothetical protein